MQRARRLASIAVTAGLGLAVLAGCRSDPSVAAYVGPEEISQAQVDALMEEIFADATAEQRESVERAWRDEVVRVLVLREVVEQYAADHDLDVPEVDPAQVAQQRGLPSDSALAQLLADYTAALTALREAAEPAPVTEADRRAAFDNATLQGQDLNELYQYEDVRRAFSDEALATTLGMRQLLDDAVAATDVTINPQYSGVMPLPVEIEGAQSYFEVSLDEGGAPVRQDPESLLELPPGQEQSDQG